MIPYQLLDVAGPMDILFNVTATTVTNYLAILPTIPKNAGSRAPNVTFHHIGPSMSPVPLTGNYHGQPTCTVDDCPKLDYLLIGGPDPKYATELPEPMKKFIIERSKEVKTIFTTCTGGLVLAATGLLDNIEATTNHACVPFGQQMAPNVKWTQQPQWVVAKGHNGCDYWTAAGATAGMDMMAHWIEQEFGRDLLNVSTLALEYQPRDINAKPLEYMNGRGEIVRV